ncbi:hypothetical protein [uncultured Polaribacter sp.]|uniref:hypothetical protein n=1 Tax=uncultured Polaribacter sp. TaxID=174711 RepID=UPI0026332AB5|nr:hypothetical protein [uncultured Polaribacter sp.]
MKFFSKKMLFLTLLCSVSISLMSFKNKTNSNFGEANVVYSSSASLNANPQEVQFTAAAARFVMVAGRYAARYSAAAARNLSRYMDEMAINTACFMPSVNDEKNGSLILDELKKMKMVSLN